jgi:predicted MFS family arabinose efflux permease
MWGLSEPAEVALVADLTEHDRLGLGYGLYDFVENLGFAIGPLLGGMLYDSIGNSAPFYLNGVILIFSAGLVLLFLRQSPAPNPGMPLLE